MRFSRRADASFRVVPGERFRMGVLNPNSEAGTALVSGVGFQPAVFGEQFKKNLPQLLGSN